jgi:hypothetical protein
MVKKINGIYWEDGEPVILVKAIGYWLLAIGL